MGLKEGGKRGGRREATPTTPNTSKCIIINSNRTAYIGEPYIWVMVVAE